MHYSLYEGLNLSQIAKEVLTSWKQGKTFETSVRAHQGRERFNFYEGPPSANGRPGIHHVLARALKDTFCRYKTMRGYYVPRRGGWDTHGLPVELQAEKELKIRKEDIGDKISIAEYNKYCRDIVLRFQREWNQLTEQIGYWADLERPYLTCDNDYIEKVWGVLGRLYADDLLYKGYSIQPYSPAAGTGLSTHELNQPNCYKIVKDTTIVAQFKCEDEANTYFLAWTTTPWTLPANTALALNPAMHYVKVATFNRYTGDKIFVILAEKALARYFDKKMEGVAMVLPKKVDAPLPWHIVDRYAGHDLIGRRYVQLMPYVVPQGKAFCTVGASFVTTEDGTGLVHIAPTFGQQDFQVAQQQGIAAIMVEREGKALPIVDRQGRFVAEITDFAHAYVKQAYGDEDEGDTLGVDIRIAKKLKQEGKAFLVASYKHSYPHCWRTDKPVLYYPLDAWFVKTTAKKKELVACNEQVNWHPVSTGQGRFKHWLENLVDWNISRTRFWGTPLPLWRTLDGKEERCISSRAMLYDEVNKSIEAGFMDKNSLKKGEIALHRPYVDDVILVSPSGQKMYRESDVVDVWFDSGAMPYAHMPEIDLSAYVGESKPAHFPADFIAEGVDQTRGWFFTLHALSVMLFGSLSYKHVLSCGLVLDKEGNKMSKRLGNTINPIELIAEKGPDPIRWYMLTNASPWENIKFDVQGIEEVKKKFFGTLYNTYQFFALYANIDGYKGQGSGPVLSNCTRMDRWILSRLHGLVRKVREGYDAYRPALVGRAVQHFVVEELSNWYVRLNRKRFWVGGDTADKRAAYDTLYLCLKSVAQLAAPIAPFYMDRLYQDLAMDKKASVHLSEFPLLDKRYHEPLLEKEIKRAQKIASLVHALRKKHKIKVRQPLQKILIPITAQGMEQEIKNIEALILSEVNIKEIVYVRDGSVMVHKEAKPNFRLAGKKYGLRIKALTQALKGMNQDAITQLERAGYYELMVDDAMLKVMREDVILTTTDLPGWAVASEGDLTVALDLEVTPLLRDEGWVREVVNRLQNLRKKGGLKVEDKINLTLFTSHTPLKEALQRYKAHMISELQVVELAWSPQFKGQAVVLFDVDGDELFAQVEKAG